MKWQGYEFDGAFRPDGFEEYAREQVNYGYAFYLRGKYVTDETGLFEQPENDDKVYIFCPRHEETFEESEKELFGTGGSVCMCCAGERMRLDPVCPRERYCGRVCKLLNAVYRHERVNNTDDFAFYQRTDRGMVLRAFSYTLRYEGEKYDLRRYGVGEFTEWMRIFYNADRTTEIWSRLGTQYNPHIGNFSYIGPEWKKKKFYQSYATFKLYGEDLSGTLLEGYAKYFARTKQYIDGEVQRAVLLLAMFKTPALKDAINAGYGGIVHDYTFSFASGQPRIGNSVRGGAKGIKKFFGFELSKLNRLSKNEKEKLTCRDIGNLKLLVKNGVAVTGEMLELSRNYRFEDLCRLYEGKELREVLKYLCRQKIDLSDYMDYVGQIKKLRLDAKDKTIAFPKNFSAAHSRYFKIIEYEATAELRRRYAAHAQRFRFICFRQGELSLRVIRTPAELKMWAQRFSNCAAGRADSVAEGRSIMCVIVNVHKPKEPYFMIEYDLQSFRIVQCRGYKNRTTEESDPAAKEFCGKWLSFIQEKGIKREAKKMAGRAA